MDNNDNLKGLGGWLILVGIGVVISPIRLLVTTVPIYQPIFTDGTTWHALTTMGSEAYHPLWAPLLIGETLINTCLVVASAYLIYLFFSKHYLFPKLYIGIVAISLVFIPLGAWVASFVLVDEPIFDPNTTSEFMRTLIGAVVWIPYMLVSKRVKATFIEKMPNKSLNLTGAKNAPPS